MTEFNRYLVLGKVGPNDWVPVGEIYAEFSGESFEFASEKQASQVRANLKNYLAHHRPKDKVPLTVRKVRVAR